MADQPVAWVRVQPKGSFCALIYGVIRWDKEWSQIDYWLIVHSLKARYDVHPAGDEILVTFFICGEEKYWYNAAENMARYIASLLPWPPKITREDDAWVIY